MSPGSGREDERPAEVAEDRPPAPLRLVIADRHPLALAGLEHVLREAGFRIVARCASGPEALAAVARHRPDVVLLDLRLPELDGVGVLRELRELPDAVPVILLGDAVGDEELLQALRLGVNGVLLKEMPSRLVVECVRVVLAGERWLERNSTARVLEILLRREAGAREIGGLLTEREVEIIRRLHRGLRNRDIAEQLHIGESTVKTHLNNIYRKLDLPGRVALMHFAVEKGLA
jgi:DNA-binding NarL/FixJ family response regulator